MSDVAVTVENLGKRYRIGLKENRHDTVFGALTSWLRSPLRNFRELRSLSQFQEDEGEDVLWALRNASFKVARGDVLGIIGPNGAGKSTLLKIVSRITEPTEGRAVLNGRVASLLEVGTGMHPELTGRENVYLNGTVLGMTKREVDRKFDEIVDFSGVEKFIDTPTKRYSSGMKVRLAFAVAAHLEPEILVIDEVLAVGDARFQKKCLGKMQDVTNQGRTVLFVSHDMSAVESLCPRVILLDGGQVAKDGPTEEVIRDYLLTDEGESSESGFMEFVTTGREGSGLIRFGGWAVVDEQLGRGQSIRSCAPCTFEIPYMTDSGAPESNVDVTVTIKDVWGRPILTSATSFVNGAFDSVPPTGVMQCRFDSLPLVPDRYHVHLWCAVSGETADKVSFAGTLDVVERDVFGTGRTPLSKHGPVLIDQFAWDVRESPGRAGPARSGESDITVPRAVQERSDEI